MKATTINQHADCKIPQTDAAVGFALHFAALIGGFLCALAPIISGYYPFGVAFCGGVKQKYIPAAAFGTAAGYFLLINKGGFSYLAALFAVIAIRIILKGNSKFTHSAAFSGIICFAVLMITAIALKSTYKGSFLPLAGQAALSGVSAYFIAVASRIRLTLSSGLDIRETVSLISFISIILLSLYPIKIIGLSTGRIAAVIFILLAGRYGQAAYGAVCGAVISFTLAIQGGKFDSTSSIFAFCGLMSGVFSSFGSLGCAASYLITNAVAISLTSEPSNNIPLFFEAVIACGIFLAIPKRAGAFFSGLLSQRTEISRLDGVKGALIMRLEFASGALHDVFETVEDVAKRLKQIHNPDFEKTLTAIENDTCGGCSLRKHCWETAREITASDTLKIWNNLKTGSAGEKPATINCLRNNAFENSIRAHCAEYDSRQAAERRISEVREVIGDQFEGISNMLFDLSEEFKYEIKYDSKAAENIILTIKNMGFHAINCIAACDKFGRISADIHIKGVADHPVNKMELVKQLSLAVGRNFDTPSVCIGGDEAFISITERPVLRIEVGISQIPESENKLCGDSCKYFTDGRGHFMLLLSDGMGTGGRAAVDSAMVSGLMSRMLRAGFGYDCSLKIINSSMLFKSTDESTATVDIAGIDLFTGECQLRKAGAAPTLVRHGGRIGKAESSSFAPGILRDIEFDVATLHLKHDDIIVMLSDGAVTEGTEWISKIIREWKVGSAQHLADEIAIAARRRRSDGHNDDITVMTAIIKQKE